MPSTLCASGRGDDWKTGFNKPSGHYEYLVTPFGLAAVFQSLVKNVLRDVLKYFVFIHVLVFSTCEAICPKH